MLKDFKIKEHYVGLLYANIFKNFKSWKCTDPKSTLRQFKNYLFIKCIFSFLKTFCFFYYSPFLSLEFNNGERYSLFHICALSFSGLRPKIENNINMKTGYESKRLLHWICSYGRSSWFWYLFPKTTLTIAAN